MTLATKLLLGAMAAAAFVAAFDISAYAASNPPTTVVLVHGAFADGSSWSRVTWMQQSV